MIERVNDIDVEKPLVENSLKVDNNKCIFKDAVFFDLEHYIYKKPICIGVFGCCFYDYKNELLKVTQYMIENKKDVKSILKLSKQYFKNMIEQGKKYIVTFSGNNDFTVINYLFKKYNMEFNIQDYFISIDLQKQYENEIHKSIGLKTLEKEFGITRESEVISGSNLAKTFSKIVKDSEYINRMPSIKKEKILLYNEQDVVSLFDIYTKWNDVFANSI
ncbi:ribonuclease H-like domain-containing protein [Clostridium luticellarii]|uniref:ribonuclease H-like domain-containing protein n=1 Tax=Clostridium luticellarii TaxID=1691940 RepID=UPI002353F637|nr:ribonuclease H-like domain-containing protein [Clostridium luticellarii]MCI1967632.1 ribonuclease H-like domain-containing protein [Clostridium luticellarii]MCI1996366.1 ribonuclease H-like domain-containing protein [Clostridium luticellarii]MCI2039941.1 ribonuclease H-like domain-containing protein [Clostridium luticellarii]